MLRAIKLNSFYQDTVLLSFASTTVYNIVPLLITFIKIGKTNEDGEILVCVFCQFCQFCLINCPQSCKGKVWSNSKISSICKYVILNSSI